MKAITGNTYPVKDALRAMGGKWDAANKAWLVPDEMAIQAQELVAQAPKSEYRRSYQQQYRNRRQSRYGSNYTRFNSGAEVYTNRNGRCEDAPCCGCCS